MKSEITNNQPDPWDKVRQTVAMETYDRGGTARVLQAIGAARCADQRFSIAADAAQIVTLRAERDALNARAATVTWGDADAVIAALVAERDAARQESMKYRVDAGLWRTCYRQKERSEMDECERAERAEQEIARLREALQEVYDAFWQAKLEVRYPHANKLAEDMLYTASPEIV
jgi:hypothetical protein